jgi:hypothetical protein
VGGAPTPGPHHTTSTLSAAGSVVPVVPLTCGIHWSDPPSPQALARHGRTPCNALDVALARPRMLGSCNLPWTGSPRSLVEWQSRRCGTVRSASSHPEFSVEVVVTELNQSSRGSRRLFLTSDSVDPSIKFAWSLAPCLGCSACPPSFPSAPARQLRALPRAAANPFPHGRPKPKIGSGSCTEPLGSRPWRWHAGLMTQSSLIAHRSFRAAADPPNPERKASACPIRGEFFPNCFAMMSASICTPPLANRPRECWVGVLR